MQLSLHRNALEFQLTAFSCAGILGINGVINEVYYPTVRFYLRVDESWRNGTRVTVDRVTEIINPSF